MKKGLLTLLLVVIGIAQASTGPLFSTAITTNSITVTPTANHYYPSMGIKITTPGVTVEGCVPHSNGYCLFDASKTASRTLTLTGSSGEVQGSICLNGQAELSCQRFSQGNSVATCQLGGICGAFVTSTTSNGNLGGLAGGNAICQARANSVGLTGVWNAWLSTATVDASTNILYDSSITYVRSSQSATIIAPPGTLLSGNIATTFLTETGVVAGGIEVFTGTLQNGTKSVGNSCLNWTVGAGGIPVLIGKTTNTDAQWTNTGTSSCSILAHIYCFQAPI